MVRAFEALDNCRDEADAEAWRLGRAPVRGDRGCGLYADCEERLSVDDRIEEFRAEKLGLDAVDVVRLLPTSESLLTNVYIEVADELRLRGLGRVSCPADVDRTEDILRSPVIGLTSIMS
jgi:hypothetical protein